MTSELHLIWETITPWVWADDAGDLLALTPEPVRCCSLHEPEFTCACGRLGHCRAECGYVYQPEER